MTVSRMCTSKIQQWTLTATFMDIELDYHTSNIKGTWQHIKRKIPASTECTVTGDKYLGDDINHCTCLVIYNWLVWISMVWVVHVSIHFFVYCWVIFSLVFQMVGHVWISNDCTFKHIKCNTVGTLKGEESQVQKSEEWLRCNFPILITILNNIHLLVQLFLQISFEIMVLVSGFHIVNQ